MVLPEERPLKSNALENDIPKKNLFKEKFQRFKENITLEPVLACYIVPNVLSKLATQNLNLEKACRVNLDFGDKICDALIAQEGKNYEVQELAVQQLIAGMEIWKNFLLTSIPSIIILYLGAWSDRTGKRKICILMPICGDLIMCLCNLIHVYYFKELPAEVSMFTEAFFPSITGGWVAIYMGAFSYIIDVSSEETRTFRIGVANLCLTAGGPIGSALSGFLLKHIGYYGVFSLSSFLYLLSIVYGCYYIKDPEMPEPIKEIKKSSAQMKSSKIMSFLRSFFDFKHVKDTLTVAFKKGPNKRRTKSILILLAIVSLYGPSYGESTIRYMFTRKRFNWDAFKFSLYNTFYICIHALGALISISLFSRHMKCDDAVLGIISMVSKIFGGLATAFARNTFQMYMAVVVETFNATSFTALRALSSRLVSSEELGKMIAVFNLVEVLTSMIFGPVYNYIYMKTVIFNVSIVYYVSTILVLPSIGIFVWFYLQQRKASIIQSKIEKLAGYNNVADKKTVDIHRASIFMIDETIFTE